MTLWTPHAVREYRRLLRSEGISPARIGKDGRNNDAWPIYSRDRQLGEIAKMSNIECEQLIFRMSFQYWLEAEAAIFALAPDEVYMLHLYVDEWGPHEYPQPFISFWWLNQVNPLEGYTFVSGSENYCSRFSALVKTYVQGFEVGDSARILETTANPWGGKRILIDFDLRCHPMKRMIPLCS